jgi:peptidoglycan/LPS O-acetylase OafA/YrhL
MRATPCWGKRALEERAALVVWCGAAHVVLARAASASLEQFASTPEGVFARLPTSPGLQRLGAVSYGVYLGHMLVLYPTLLMLAREVVSPTTQAAVLLGVVVVGTWLLAKTIHVCVERPGIRLGGRLAARWEAASIAVPASSSDEHG